MRVRYDDIPLETKQGKPVDVTFVSNTYLVDGKAVIQCNIRDITERVQGARTLAASESREVPDSGDRCDRVWRAVATATGDFCRL